MPWRGCREVGALVSCWWASKMVQPLWKTVWRFLKKVKIELPYDPAIPLLSTSPKEERRGHTEHIIIPSTHSTVLHNGQEMGVTQVSTDRGVGKHSVVYMHNGILFGTKKGILKWYNTEEPGGHYGK